MNLIKDCHVACTKCNLYKNLERAQYNCYKKFGRSFFFVLKQLWSRSPLIHKMESPTLLFQLLGIFWFVLSFHSFILLKIGLYGYSIPKKFGFID